jgi:hypothetical protein
VLGVAVATVLAVHGLSRAEAWRGEGKREWSDGAALVLMWLLVYLLPTALAEGSPHFLRAAGALPAVMLLPALGAVGLGRLAGRLALWGPRLAWVVAIVAVLGEGAATLSYAREATTGLTAQDLYFQFESGATDLAADVNGALGRGWQGGWAEVGPAALSQGAGDNERFAAELGATDAEPAATDAEPAGRDAEPAGRDAEAAGRDVEPADRDAESAGSESKRAGRDVWLDRRLRDGWASVPYLVSTDEVTASGQLTLTDPYDPVLTTGPGVVYLWPYDIDIANVWSALAPNLRLDFTSGSYERGDLDSEPQLLYLRVDATPARPITETVGAFANHLVLIQGSVARSSDGRVLFVETEWALEEPVDRDVTAFVQVLEGDSVIDGSDAPLGEGRFPVPMWRIGDRVVERRMLRVPGGFDPSRQRIIVGLYEWPDLERIPVRGADGRPLGDHLSLTVQ